MYQPASTFILRLLKVPPEPSAPFGDPASLRVFRAGRNYFRLRLFAWGLAEALALAGIIFWAVVLSQVEADVRTQRQARAARPQAPAAAPAPTFQNKVEAWKNSLVEHTTAAADPGTPAGKSDRKHRTINGWAGFKQVFVEIALVLPDWAFPVLWCLKIFGLAIYLGQIPFTYALRRLDYEMRWYVVTDRSLRIRTGTWNVQELTMSFANLQQVVVTQGPIQRLLGLADVRVQSAGGGGGQPGQHRREHSLHMGYFHGVEHASEIRDLILERLKRFRESGLGDPEETRHQLLAAAVATTPLPVPAAGAQPALLAAARELRDEARALRMALE